MSPNTIVALAVVAALLLSPLILLTSPIWGLWLFFQNRGRIRRGYRVLLPFMERTLLAYAKAMIRSDEPLDFSHVPGRIDFYLYNTGGPRIWRIAVMVVMMELVPLVTLRPPFTWMGEEARKRFCDRHLTQSSGILGLLSLSKQIVRLAYYSKAETHTHLGFVPVEKRGERRKHEGPVPDAPLGHELTGTHEKSAQHEEARA